MTGGGSSSCPLEIRITYDLVANSIKLNNKKINLTTQSISPFLELRLFLIFAIRNHITIKILFAASLFLSISPIRIGTIAHSRCSK